MLPFARISIIGLGLIGSSVARAVKVAMPDVRVTGFDADADVRERARALRFCDDVADTAGTAVIDAGLVILCVPVGAMGAVALDMRADLPVDAIISDDLAVRGIVPVVIAGNWAEREMTAIAAIAGVI